MVYVVRAGHLARQPCDQLQRAAFIAPDQAVGHPGQPSADRLEGDSRDGGGHYRYPKIAADPGQGADAADNDHVGAGNEGHETRVHHRAADDAVNVEKVMPEDAQPGSDRDREDSHAEQGALDAFQDRPRSLSDSEPYE